MKTRYTAYSATLHLKYIDFGVSLEHNFPDQRVKKKG